MPSFIKTLWADKIIQALYEDNDLSKLFNRELESYVRSQGGNKITLPLLGANSSIQRTDNMAIGTGLPLSVVDVSKDALELSIYEYTYGPINIRKIDDVQSNMSLLEHHIREITQAFKEYIFTAAATNIITNVDATHKKPWTASSGAAFSYADLKAMKKLLNQAKIMKNNRFVLIDEEADDDLQSDDYLKNWLAVQQANIVKGEMPELQGFGFNPSVLIPKTTTAGVIDATPANNTKSNVLGYRKDYLHLVIQTEMEIVGAEDPTRLGFVAAFTSRFGLLLEKAKSAVQYTEQ